MNRITPTFIAYDNRLRREVRDRKGHIERWYYRLAACRFDVDPSTLLAIPGTGKCALLRLLTDMPDSDGNPKHDGPALAVASVPDHLPTTKDSLS